MTISTTTTPTTTPSAMGPVLKGFSPPFTPSGRSAYWPVEGEAGYRGVQPIHNGVFINFEADADALASLLPAPLTANENTGNVSLFINQTTLLPTGLTDVSTVEPDASQFLEALITFPCELDGRELGFHYVMYTDSDWCLYCGPVSGLTTKLADIRFMDPPRTLHPNWAKDKPGSLFRGSVSRGGNRLIDVSFAFGEQLEDSSGVFSAMTEIVGMRYFPDLTNWQENAPLVHDLVLQTPVGVEQGPVYAGEATLEFSSTATDELQFFTPKRIIDAHYITGLSHNNLGLEVIHDYLGAR